MCEGYLRRIVCFTQASQVALVVKNPPANAGDIRDAGSIPGSGRSPGGGHGNPLQYSCLGNSMNRASWQATVHRVTESQTRLKRLTTHTLLPILVRVMLATVMYKPQISVALHNKVFYSNNYSVQCSSLGDSLPLNYPELQQLLFCGFSIPQGLGSFASAKQNRGGESGEGTPTS